MHLFTIVRLSLIGAILALAACQQIDPYTRDYMWQPTGSVQGNLAAMVANPDDLIRGRGQATEDTKEPTLAINHVWTDQPKTLLDPGSSAGSGTNGSGGGGSGSSSSGSSGSSGSGTSGGSSGSGGS
jgi:uncharacterized membrane protein YgcG